MAAAICGSQGGGPKALPALLGALEADVPGASEQWSPADGGTALGCRSDQRPEGFAVLHMDRQAGLAVVADARLDDRQALCDALGVAVAERGAVSDAALILRAWRQWGTECPRRLLGDYAFALWDGQRRALFCARDHVGTRPFYYAVQGGAFLFGSTVEAVLAAPGVSPALDEAVVATHLASSSTSSERSFFAAVRKLPPGCSLLVESPRNGAAGEPRLRRRRWWRPEDAPSQPPASDDAYAEQLLALCRQAVRDRLRGYGAGEVGAHLSGGLDSSSIAVLLARELRELGRPAPTAFAWLPALGAAPPEPAHAPEYALVDAVCRQERLRACFGAPTPDDLLGVLRQDCAVPGIHVHPNEEIVQRNAAAAGARLLLSGWGGDECASFGGRGHLQGLLLRGRWRQLALECRAQDAALAPFLANVALPLVHPALPDLLRRLRGREGPRRRWLIDPAFARRTRLLTVPQRRPVGVRRAQLGLLANGHLCARMEGWAASGARRGIEYAYPLLDRRLVAFVLGLPPEQFRRGKCARWLFRHAMRTVLPPEVCWNVQKRDPARSEPLVGALVAQFPTIRALLVAQPPSRAGYVDMASLLERLDENAFRARPEPGPLMRALRFLDF